MNNDERWMQIKPGSRVDFPQTAVIKLADQWDRYTGINEHCCVEIGRNGMIIHVSCLIDLHAPFTGDFE